MRAAGQTMLDISLPEIKDFEKYRKFLKAIKLQHDCLQNDGMQAEDCMVPACIDVIDTLGDCKQKGKHYIILLDGSGSVTNANFKNMLKTVQSMLWFPMNGYNKVTIIEFSDSVRVRCSSLIDHDKIKDCLFSGNQIKGSTDTAGAFEKAVDFMMDGNYENIVALFTDGHSDTGIHGDRMKNAFNSVNSLATRFLSFGIGKRYNMDELKFFAGGSTTGITLVEDFSSFEKHRFKYQGLICKS